MNVNSPASQLRDWLDRNPVTVGVQGQSTVAAGASGSTALYTVPAGKRAILHTAEVHPQFDVAPGAADRILGIITVTRSGGSATNLMVEQAKQADGIYGSPMIISPQVLLDAGDVVSVAANAAISATSGKAQAYFTLTEFDRIL